jgi:two-component system, OmpR family, phosphate regulon sensor histidine kinase PhoR
MASAGVRSRSWLPLPLKLMLSYLLVAALIALPVFYPLRDSLRGTLERAEQQGLLAQAREVAAALRGHSDAALVAQVTSFARVLQARVTVIDAAGHVIADSEVASAVLARVENHAARPEVRHAREVGAGVDARHSATIGVDLVYAAVPLDPDHFDGEIVRIASPRARVAQTVADAMLALRLGVGVGVSAALALSLVAALLVSLPLRRLRDVARAFAVADWVEVKRPRSRDELRELADALDELGRQLRHQLVAVGAAEALVLQAVESLAMPAVLLSDTFTPLAVNGALRLRAGLTPDLEDSVFADVRAELGVRAADHRDLARVPIRALMRGAMPDDARFHVTALARPDAPPLWLLVLEGPDRDGLADGRRDV